MQVNFFAKFGRIRGGFGFPRTRASTDLLHANQRATPLEMVCLVTGQCLPAVY